MVAKLSARLMIMIKYFLTLTSIFLFLGTLTLGPMISDGLFEVETEDVEVKLEGEKEDIIATLTLFELHQDQYLYDSFHFPEYIFSDYKVYPRKKVKPPRA